MHHTGAECCIANLYSQEDHVMRRMTILGSAMRLILCAVVLTLVLLPRAAPVHAAGGLLAWSEEGVSFTTFGPNDLITIDTGTIEFINNCPSGVDDSFL